MTADNTQHDGRDRGLAEAALQLAVREASRVPLTALGIGLRVWEHTRDMRELALRRGAIVLQLAAHTPLGRFLPQPDLDDDAQDEATRIAQHARESRLTPVAPATPTPPSDRPSSPPRPQAGKPATAPKPAQPPAAAVEAGAPGAVADKVDKVAEKLSVDQPESRDELPIPDFDNVSLGSLRARLRSLSLEQLVTLREWEQEHGNRLPVITLLDNRIAKVADSEQSTNGRGTGTSGAATPAPAYPAEAPADAGRAVDRAEQAAEDEGGTLRI